MGATSHVAGQLGRLQVLAVIPVCAGDSVKITWRGAIRMSPLQRYMTVDPQYDLMVSYRPHRHSYGQQFVNLMTDGIKETETFPGVSVTNVAYLGLPLTTGTLPQWWVGHYNKFFNEYIRVPTDASGIRAENFERRMRPLESLERLRRV